MHRGFTYGLITGFLAAVVLLGSLAVMYVWLTGQAG